MKNNVIKKYKFEIAMEIAIVVLLVTLIYLFDTNNMKQYLNIVTDGTFVAAALAVPLALTRYFKSLSEEKEMKYKDFFYKTLRELDNIYLQEKQNTEKYHSEVKFMTLSRIYKEGKIIENSNLYQDFVDMVMKTYFEIIMCNLKKIIKKEIPEEDMIEKVDEREEILKEIYQELIFVEKETDKQMEKYFELNKNEILEYQRKYIKEVIENLSWKEKVKEVSLQNESDRVYFYKPEMYNEEDIDLQKINMHYFFGENLSDKYYDLLNIYPIKNNDKTKSIKPHVYFLGSLCDELNLNFENKTEKLNSYSKIKNNLKEKNVDIRISSDYSNDGKDLKSWFSISEKNLQEYKNIEYVKFLIINKKDINKSVVICFKIEDLNYLISKKQNDPFAYHNDKYFFYFNILNNYRKLEDTRFGQNNKFKFEIDINPE